MIVTEEGRKVQLYCGECGSVLGAENVYGCFRAMYSFRCHRCEHSTPLFAHQFDALKYYKNAWGATMEWVDEE